MLRNPPIQVRRERLHWYPDETAFVVQKTGSGEWREISVTISDGYFSNRAAGGGADLYLHNEDREDDIFHMVEPRRNVAFHDFDSESTEEGAGWWYGGWKGRIGFVTPSERRCACMETSTMTRELARGFEPSEISFKWAVDRLEGQDSLHCDIKLGATWKTIWTYEAKQEGPDSPDSFREVNLQLPSSERQLTAIRFRLEGDVDDDDFYIDDVLLLGGTGGSISPKSTP